MKLINSTKMTGVAVVAAAFSASALAARALTTRFTCTTPAWK